MKFREKEKIEMKEERKRREEVKEDEREWKKTEKFES